MFIHKLRVKNWCQFEEREVEFGTLTAFRGPNGSGKSNLLGALVFAFTEHLRSPGTKDQNVRKQLGEDDESGVWVDFSHQGSTCQLYRGLVPNKQHLVINGEKFTKNPEVRAKLRQLLDVDMQLLLDYVFVPQWGIFNFISQKDSERAKAFSQLFGTEKAERIWDALRDFKPPPAVVTIDGQAVQARLETAKASLAQAEEAVSLLGEEVTLLEASREATEKVVETYGLRQRLQRDASDMQEHLRVQARKVEQSKEAVERQELAAQQAELKLKEVQDEAGLRAGIKAWEDYRSYTHQREAAEYELRLQQQYLQKVGPAPVKPAGYLDQAARSVALSDIARDVHELRTATAFLSSCDPERGQAACPTCGTSTNQPDLAQRVREAKAELEAIKTRLPSLKAAVEQSGAYDHAYGEWEKAVNKAQQLVNVKEQALRLLGERDAPPSSEQALRDLLNNQVIFKHRYDKARRELEVAKQALYKEEVTQAAFDTARRNYETRLAELPVVTPGDYQAALTERQTLQESKTLLQRAQLQRAGAEQTVAECAGLLVKFEEERRRSWHVRRVTQHLDDVRREFHRDRLPAAVSQYYLNTMQQDINNVLTEFDSPFRVESVENLNFVVKFADGTLMPAERLSGGEKVVLAMAFRITINSMFAAELGLLCMDEPTAGLDETNLMTCLQTAMSRLKNMGETRGLQVVLITHEKGLDNLCDSVVTLSK